MEIGFDWGWGREPRGPAGKAGQVGPSSWRAAADTLSLSGDELDAELRARAPEPSLGASDALAGSLLIIYTLLAVHSIADSNRHPHFISSAKAECISYRSQGCYKSPTEATEGAGSVMLAV